MTVYQTYSFQTVAAGVPQDSFALPVRILGTGLERRQEASYRWDNQRHGQKFHVLQYTLGGQGLFHWGGTGPDWEATRLVGPGDLFVASWSTPYLYEVADRETPWEFRWIILEGEWADRVLARVCRNSRVLSFDLRSSPVVLMENLHRRLELRDSWDRFALSTVGYELCLSLLKEAEAEIPGDREVEREAEAWVLAHLESADCPSLAAHFGYNGRYFAEYFHRHTGTTPQKFIVDRKVRYAAMLLTCTARTVGSIAADLGFSEDNYFSRVFRNQTGQSPQEYRRTHSGSLLYDVLVPV